MPGHEEVRIIGGSPYGLHCRGRHTCKHSNVSPCYIKGEAGVRKCMSVHLDILRDVKGYFLEEGISK
jgi:hypothetical protein